eukprot:TRINITY_DN25470_c0_g1_i1.p1 TRINITY_DN25470_c0_g1~~TRINITY_DN25470_c0_g1_i1.p1  ORF type:complete len:554 (+),score=167.48 TRINITY_DN25470_c0_g1_i1:199-1662(+)
MVKNSTKDLAAKLQSVLGYKDSSKQTKQTPTESVTQRISAPESETEVGRLMAALLEQLNLDDTGVDGARSIQSYVHPVLLELGVKSPFDIAVAEGLQKAPADGSVPPAAYSMSTETCRGLVSSNQLHEYMQSVITTPAAADPVGQAVPFLSTLAVVAARHDTLLALACVLRAKELVGEGGDLDLDTKLVLLYNLLRHYAKAEEVGRATFTELLQESKGEAKLRYVPYGLADAGLQLAFALVKLGRAQEADQLLRKVRTVQGLPLPLRNSMNLVADAVAAEMRRNASPLDDLDAGSALWVAFSSLRSQPAVREVEQYHSAALSIQVLAKALALLIEPQVKVPTEGGADAEAEQDPLRAPPLSNVSSAVVFVEDDMLEGGSEGCVEIRVSQNTEESIVKGFTAAIDENHGYIPGIALCLDNQIAEQAIATHLRFVEADGNIASLPPALLWSRHLAAVFPVAKAMLVETPVNATTVNGVDGPCRPDKGST